MHAPLQLGLRQLGQAAVEGGAEAREDLAKHVAQGLGMLTGARGQAADELQESEDLLVVAPLGGEVQRGRQEGGQGLLDGVGAGGLARFELVEALADAIGRNKAAVGSSRAACDLGWYPPSQQVGLTGKVVTPDLYTAIAISGASQHMAGCSGSKTIVAINRDSEANIFKAARYGIVGDYKEVLPPLIEAVKNLG